jgi:hypothetical protein
MCCYIAEHNFSDISEKFCIVQFPQIQPTKAHKCHLIHNNIFKNIELLHVLDLPAGSTLIGVVYNSY